MKQEKITPDKYFLSKVEEEQANVIGLIRDKKLIRYIIEQPDKSKEAIDKLKDFALNSKSPKIKRNALKTCSDLGLVDDEFLKEYQASFHKKKSKKKPSSHKSKLYNPPVGEFGFCCEEERMAIVFNHIKDIKNFDVFQREFTTRYPYEASLVSQSDMERLYKKYYEYATNGKLAEIQHQRRNRINSTLSQDIINILKKYGLRVTRADGRGTSKPLKKCRRKKQYDADRLSGYQIISIKRGIPIAGKKFELYEDDVKDFTEKLISGEIVLDEALAKERL